MNPAAVCQRCGAHLKYPIRVGQRVFGSECVQKLTAADFAENVCGDLAPSLLAWLKLQKKAVELNPADIPGIGMVGHLSGSTLSYTVIGYTPRGVKLRAIWNGYTTYFDLPFGRSSDFVLETENAIRDDQGRK